MKKACLLVLAIAFWGMTGCGKTGQSNSAEADKALQAIRKSFDSAPAELKAKYEAIRTALDGNDLANAKANLDQLLQAQLTPEQQQAVAEQQQNLLLKASTAAQNGDANAAKILQDARARSRGR